MPKENDNLLEGPEKDPKLERLESLSREKERVVDLFRKYVGEERAKNLGEKLLKVAEDLDRIAETIKKNPNIKKEYTYDGLSFKKPGSEWRILRLRDGIGFLKAFNEENIKPFFENNREGKGLAEWVKEQFLDEAKARLERLDKNGTIEMLGNDEKGKAESKSTPETARDNGSYLDDFLSGYEIEMEAWKKEQGIE